MSCLCGGTRKQMLNYPNFSICESCVSIFAMQQEEVNDTTKLYREIQEAYELGNKLHLWDFDSYDCNENGEIVYDGFQEYYVQGSPSETHVCSGTRVSNSWPKQILCDDPSCSIRFPLCCSDCGNISEDGFYERFHGIYPLCNKCAENPL